MRLSWIWVHHDRLGLLTCNTSEPPSSNQAPKATDAAHCKSQSRQRHGHSHSALSRMPSDVGQSAGNHPIHCRFWCIVSGSMVHVTNAWDGSTIVRITTQLTKLPKAMRACLFRRAGHSKIFSNAHANRTLKQQPSCLCDSREEALINCSLSNVR